MKEHNKRKLMKKERYIYDALYGIIYLSDFIWDIISCSELQRLREVRLCNINSLCLTGGANINRYEHAIGTCYLAKICLENWPPLNPITKEEEVHFLLAALLHDVVSGAFGHSIEYIEGFKHEEDFIYAVTGKKGGEYEYMTVSTEPIFFGMPREFVSRLEDLEKNLKKRYKEKVEINVKKIGEIIAGRGRFGPLLNSIMDLDNIDNVFRLAYHIGLVKSGEVPLKLAKSLYIKGKKLVVKREAIPLIKEWYNVRKKLYSFLLLNPEEFSAKCMLTEAIELAKLKERKLFRWYYVDFELLEKVSRIPLVEIPVKKPVPANLEFTLNINFKKELDKLIISEDLKSILLEQYDIKLSSSATVEKNEDGWKIRDKGKEYLIKEKREGLLIYQIVKRGENISTIISRLMKGELYGCIGIFSTSRTEKANTFFDFSKKRELEDELSSIIREKYGSILSKLKNVMTAIHPIIDVNKTERQVIIDTDDGETIKVGESSKQLLIGVFFRNKELNIYDLYSLNEKHPKKLKKVKEEVYKYLVKILDDKNIKRLELYGEVNGYG